jgi:2-methylcitrate dehydratase PrpD
MTALQTLGSFVAEGVRGHVPDATRKRTGLHVIDAVGAWVAGAHTPEGQALIAARKSAAERERTASHNDLSRAIPLHCALARLSEADNIHLASSITPGGIVVPAALTIAAALEKTDGEAILEAIVAGTEAMVRLGLAIDGPTILYRGIWPTYFAAPFGVAAAAARLYDLDAAQTAHALALALSFAAPGVGSHNAQSTSRWLTIGHAAHNGLIAARAAQAGFTSDLNLLDGGFLNGVYGITPNINGAVADLGRRYAIDDTSIKPWCAARQTIAATQGLLELIADGLSPAEITAVEVHVPPAYLKMVNHSVESGNRASYLTSVPYRLAVAACDLGRLYDVGSSASELPDDMRLFMQRVSVMADQTLLTYYPRVWPARIVVHAAGGRRERLVIAVPGDPQRPFDERQVEDKFHRILASIVAERVDRLFACARAVFEANESPAALIAEIERQGP